MKQKINPIWGVFAGGIALLLQTGASYAVTQDSTLTSNLGEVVLTASFLNEKRSPLRLSTVNRSKIEKRSIGATYPELVKDIPGIYATSESGSYGDARINIRGFKQENISVMLNGIPI
ncbi:MAG: TonB-dependent receptor plug domain-containing protein [Bacteroidales bacterium]|nr:TonB-dependent receptor plug domain-containing protein [Bacteroidales bacterium]